MMVETLSGANIEQLGCWDHRGVTFLQHPELWERWGQRNHENCQQYFKMSHLSRMEFFFFFKHLSWFYWEDHLNRQIFRWESWAQRAVWDSLVASNGFDGNIHPTQWDVATFPWENPWENPWEKSTPFFLELPMAKNHRTYRPFQGGRIYGVWEWCSMRLGWGSLQIQSAVDVYGCLWFMLVGFEIVGW